MSEGPPMIRSVLLLTILAVLVHAGALGAHHSYVAVFDPGKKVTLSGTLTKVDWRNPHVELSIEAKGPQGQVEAWIVEAGPPAFFSRNKVSKVEFEKAIGRQVTLEMYRARDGNLLGALLKITFEDGRVVTSEPSA